MAQRIEEAARGGFEVVLCTYGSIKVRGFVRGRVL